MKLALVNLYPPNTLARYQLSSYVLKAYLDKYFKEKNELLVNILNFSNFTDTLKICKTIINEKPDCVGYSCYVWNIEKIYEIIQNLKKSVEFTNILGGPEISLDKIKLFPDSKIGDYYVVGEGERTLLNLMECIIKKDKGPIVKIPDGVAVYINNKFEYVPNNNRIINLDEIPSIYLNNTIEDCLYKRQQAFLETQRGCPYKCKYCVYHKNFSTISFYSLDRIYDELEHLIVKKRVSALRILDSVFTYNLPRAKEIAQRLIKLKKIDGIKMPWIYWEFIYDMADEEFLKLVSALKYRRKILNINAIKPLNRLQLYNEIVKDYTVINCIGVESFNAEALRAVGRAPINFGKFKKFLNVVYRNNIILKIDLILGLPFETFNSYFEGLEFFLSFFKNVDHILNLHLLQILPGSDLEKLYDKYRIKYSTRAPHIVFSTNGISEKEMNYASKLTAILFRILNSPLRSAFYNAKERRGGSFLRLIENIFRQMPLLEEFKNTQIIKKDSVDDYYWNGDVFKEIPSEWLLEILSGY